MAAPRPPTRRGAGRRPGPPKDDLKAIWERNKAIRKRTSGTKLSPRELQSLPPHIRHLRPLSPREYQSLSPQLRGPAQLHGYARPKGLRGPALVQWLMLLGGTWQDKRFHDCINALLEHGIVEPYTHKFTDRQGPLIDNSNEYLQSRCLAEVRARTEQCGSERQASRQIAAEWGLPGNSLEAVAKRLRDQLRPSKK
jgi:hypothetical protein